MSERATRLAAPGVLLILLAIAVVVPADLELGDPESDAPVALEAVLSDLPAAASALIAFDPDLGTYAEVRPTVRTLLADLVARGVDLSMISLTPEGRALSWAERDRIGRLAGEGPEITDLGFVPGAEAALVTISGAINGTGDLVTPAGIRALAAPDLIIVVGGNDLGPRSWVEQVLPRIDPIPVVAVTPTSLLPEVEPYRASGQLAALIGTPRDGASYRQEADLEGGVIIGDPAGGPAGLAILAGLVLAIAWLGEALVRRLRPGFVAPAERER